MSNRTCCALVLGDIAERCLTHVELTILSPNFGSENCGHHPVSGVAACHIPKPATVVPELFGPGYKPTENCFIGPTSATKAESDFAVTVAERRITTTSPNSRKADRLNTC